MKTYTATDVATLAGISVRTLHHHDELGLLKPAFVGDNRYRHYGEDELLRLQQILFYREFGVPLSEIAALLDKPDFELLEALGRHRERLLAEARRNRQLVRTIDRTIAKLKGDRAMRNEELYKGFSPEKQADYEDWLIAEHGEGMRQSIDTSKQHMATMSEAERDRSMAELQELETALAGKMSEGVAPDTPALDDLLSRHRAWVASMWGRECPPDAYAGLAELYLSHPDFVKRYETIAEGFADYLSAAKKAHAARQ